MKNSVSLIEKSPVDRQAQADNDISFLRGAWANLSPIERALVDLDAGRLALARKKLGEAMGFWRAATLEAPGSAWRVIAENDDGALFSRGPTADGRHLVDAATD